MWEHRFGPFHSGGWELLLLSHVFRKTFITWFFGGDCKKTDSFRNLNSMARRAHSMREGSPELWDLTELGSASALPGSQRIFCRASLAFPGTDKEFWHGQICWGWWGSDLVLHKCLSGDEIHISETIECRKRRKRWLSASRYCSDAAFEEASVLIFLFWKQIKILLKKRKIFWSYLIWQLSLNAFIEVQCWTSSI